MSYEGTSSQKAAKNQSKPSQDSLCSRLNDIRINEEVKIAVNVAMERFQYSDDKEMEFPSSFHAHERAYVHRMARSLGFISRSKGKKSRRVVTVKKKDVSNKPQPAMPLSLSSNSLFYIRNLLQRFPITNKERIDLQPNTSSSTSVTTDSDGNIDKNRTRGRLNNGIPLVPPMRTPSELDSFRRSLPVHERREEIVQLIKENKVVLIVGETGSGKTTQIPQFLLDDCSTNEMPCRIFCTQPRRLAAIAVAERVAAERGERVGQTVGYHIRLESRVSPRTSLTFCTSGVFLRTLMGGDDSLLTVTHAIVDEVHERDGLTDFLLTKIRDVIQKIPTLKLVLSSAALDVDLFCQYFGSCPVVYIKGRQFEVKEVFLEDVLRFTGYSNKDMMKFKEDAQRTEKKQKRLTEWCQAVENGSVQEEDTTADCAAGFVQDSSSLEQGNKNSNKLTETGQLHPWLLKEMDSCIFNIFLNEDQDAFIQLFNLILNENVNVDYMHSETGVTSLMVAAGRGFVEEMKQLLVMGADVNTVSSSGWTALEFAMHFQQADAVDLLKSSMALGEQHKLDESALESCGTIELSAEEQELLDSYHRSFDDDRVDLDLILNLLYNICTTSSDGAILIFLPGYEEIVTLRDHILCDDQRFSTLSERCQVFTLHSDMQTLDQKRAMKNSPPGIRKIILSTNIAETSITINDVVFVIDSGKVKEKSFDTLNRVSMLKSVWISKASAVQRKGRAGRCRPGICFHLFSRLRFNNMLEFQIPQLLRMPLQDVCLQTKLLAPSTSSVAEFLSKAPQPPPAHAVKNAIQMLKMTDAMDQSEDLTDLGYHLADLPVEPHLGKMVLCAVLLKCLDPILTIACTLAYRDPFILPSEGSQKRAALLCRKQFTSNSFSDHMAFLRSFQAWQKARSEGCERSFCEKNFLSQATMNMILGMRTQLLGQLRAIGFVRARGGSDIRDVNLNSENWAVVKAALVAGMYPNLIHTKTKVSGIKEKRVNFHPTSAFSLLQLKEKSSAKPPQNLPTDWFIYDEMTRSHSTASVRCCTMVTPIVVAIFAGCAKLPSSALQEPVVQKDSTLNDSSDSEVDDLAEMKIDDWLIFELDKEVSCSNPVFPQPASSVVRYFIMKSSNLRNIEISQQKGIWSTTPSNEPKLNKAFLENNVIILIFSVQGSGHFQGYARMMSSISQESCDDWGFIGLGGVFSVEWIRKESLPFHCSQHIQNPWNDNKKVQISRDGQELEPQAGSQLLLMWESS
ncbi:3'-5' RNA helicase YTHDC2 [Thalassophryne amazonica]|uniref:3'-5' RNA helicase YTHDC2 n=1 Tax=Thalassophryne amazonica TaxID=390379 RepID=UPI0014720A44|nr:3'-5' RNA helicase YTHDC2 [Thalassophryne amazonica]